jgi:hypothetical protein
MAGAGQRIGDGGADLARQVVVAGAAEAQIGVAPPRRRLGGRRHTGAGHGHQRFDGMRHV